MIFAFARRVVARWAKRHRENKRRAMVSNANKKRWVV
jgi:hypothetical protein